MHVKEESGERPRMSKQTRAYRVWDATAEEALRSGVRKHGLGAWELIRKDPEFEILRYVWGQRSCAYTHQTRRAPMIGQSELGMSSCVGATGASRVLWSKKARGGRPTADAADLVYPPPVAGRHRNWMHD